MSTAHFETLAAGVAMAMALAASGAAQPAPSQAVGEGTAASRPSVSTLKSDLDCERISPQPRLSMHGMAHCNAVNDQLLKREFEDYLRLRCVS